MLVEKLETEYAKEIRAIECALRGHEVETRIRKGTGYADISCKGEQWWAKKSTWKHWAHD